VAVQPSLTRRSEVELALIPALKGRAKFKHRYAVKPETKSDLSSGKPFGMLTGSW